MCEYDISQGECVGKMWSEARKLRNTGRGRGMAVKIELEEKGSVKKTELKHSSVEVGDMGF